MSHDTNLKYNVGIVQQWISSILSCMAVHSIDSLSTCFAITSLTGDVECHVVCMSFKRLDEKIKGVLRPKDVQQ